MRGTASTANWTRCLISLSPQLRQFGGVYYLGWQDATLIGGQRRTIFNLDISRDGQTWERKYRFETPASFQYPAFHEHQGAIWLSVTQGPLKDRIMFGKLEDVGQFESLAGKTREALRSSNFQIRPLASAHALAPIVPNLPNPRCTQARRPHLAVSS